MLAGLLQDWLMRYKVAEPTASAPLLVAYSGGLDSTALLSVAHGLWPGAVRALHVNHGLQSLAPVFEAHCTSVCALRGIPLDVQRVRVALVAGDSTEEQARQSRYQALADAALRWRGTAVWLAQHADDQAETVLLALSRGAGVPGLAAMGGQMRQHGVCFGRPWLTVRQAQLRAHVVQAGWPWMDDPTNTDTRFTRNRIRHEVMPALLAAFPAMVETLGRSARHCAQASELLEQTAQQDLMLVGMPPRIEVLKSLTPSRQANVLRHWLQQVAGRAPSTVQLDELRKQIAAARTRGQRIHIKVAAGMVVREGAVLQYQAG
jgi:tRNA(Ile)-lysidine synthase